MEQPTKEDALRYGQALAQEMRMPIYVYALRDRLWPFAVTPDERLAQQRCDASGYIRCEPASARVA
jgi:hypothetical protein